MWVGTVAGSSITGRCENGYTVFASGNDENGNPVSNYTLGKGLVEILEADADLKPGADIKYVRIFDEEPITPKDGDVWQLSGSWYIYQDGQSWPIGDDSGLIGQLSAELSTKQDVLTEQQLSVIDSAVDEMNTMVKFANGAISSYSVVGDLEYGTAIGWETEAGSQITEVKLGNTVKRLMSRAFSDINSLTRIEIPNSVTKLDEYSFVNCWNLSSINIPDSVSSIGENVFDRNFKLSTLTIPKNVSNVGYSAFSYCSALTSVVFKDRTLDEVQAMANYPWYVSDVSVITTENNATQEWVDAKFDTTTKFNYTLSTISQTESDPYILSSMLPIVVTLGNSSEPITITDPSEVYMDKLGTEPNQVYDLLWTNGTTFFITLATCRANGIYIGHGTDVDTITFGGNTPVANTTQILGFKKNYILDDRTINTISVSPPFYICDLTFPSSISNHARDFSVRVVADAGTYASTPMLSVSGVTLMNTDGEMPEIATDTTNACTTIFYFSEIASNVFLVKGEQLEAITL